MSTLTIAHTKNARRNQQKPFLLAWRERLRRRREFWALLSQPDYLLEDIGVDRHQIMREASKPFWLA